MLFLARLLDALSTGVERSLAGLGRELLPGLLLCYRMSVRRSILCRDPDGCLTCSLLLEEGLVILVEFPLVLLRGLEGLGLAAWWSGSAAFPAAVRALQTNLLCFVHPY